MDGSGYPTVQRPDGTAVETAPTHCPNGHELRYPNVIVAHWPSRDPASSLARGTA
jgi:hypothetical protein